MGQTIQVKRGIKANLPTLNNGEFALTTDTKDVYVGTPTGNELVGGKSVNASLAENATIYLVSRSDYVEGGDNTLCLQNAIDYLKVNGGGDIIIGQDITISNTIYFYGEYGGSYGFNTIVRIVGKNGAKIKSTLSTGNVFSFGKVVNSVQQNTGFKVMFHDITIDATKKNVTVFQGMPYAVTGTEPNVIIEMHNVNIIEFSGVNACGIEMGYMTDCRFMNVRINGDNADVGIKARRDNNQLFNVEIAYCKYGIYVVNFGEGNIKMIGGSIMVCDHNIAFEGGGYLINGSYFKGTMLAEPRTGDNMITVLNPSGFYIYNLNFESCIFNSVDPLDGSLIDLTNISGKVSITGCTCWGLATHTNINIGTYTLLTVSGNSVNTTYTGVLSNLTNLDSNHNYETIIFNNPNTPPSSGGDPMYYYKTITTKAIQKKGKIVSITNRAVNPVSVGTCDIQVVINGSYLTTPATILNSTNPNTVISDFANPLAVNKGDLLTIVTYTSANFVQNDIFVEVLVEYD